MILKLNKLSKYVFLTLHSDQFQCVCDDQRNCHHAAPVQWTCRRNQVRFVSPLSGHDRHFL